MSTRKTSGPVRNSPAKRVATPSVGSANPPSTIALQATALEVVLRDYGFGVTCAVLVVDRATGRAIEGLESANFEVHAIQAPNGWSLSDKLSISSGVSEHQGAHLFSINKQGQKLANGPWTLVVAVTGTHKAKHLHGRTLATIVV
jgi:hypothetical protein